MNNPLRYKGELIVFILALWVLFCFFISNFDFYWYVYEVVENIAYSLFLAFIISYMDKFGFIAKLSVCTLISIFSVNLFFSLVIMIIKLNYKIEEVDYIIAKHRDNYIIQYSAPIIIFILVILIWKVALKKK